MERLVNRHLPKYEIGLNTLHIFNIVDLCFNYLVENINYTFNLIFDSENHSIIDYIVVDSISHQEEKNDFEDFISILIYINRSTYQKVYIFKNIINGYTLSYGHIFPIFY